MFVRWWCGRKLSGFFVRKWLIFVGVGEMI